jgi:hypothetical protein
MRLGTLLIVLMITLGLAKFASAEIDGFQLQHSDKRCDIIDPIEYCHTPAPHHCTGGCSDPWKLAYCGAVGRGTGPVVCGLGPNAWWSPAWGTYPGHACYARNGAGHTFQSQTSEDAMSACLNDEYYIPECQSLGCD